MGAAGHTGPSSFFRMSSVEVTDHTSRSMLLDRIAEGVGAEVQRQRRTKGDSSPLEQGSRLQG